MSYIVKSSLEIGGKIIPGNEIEMNKLIEEKEELLKKKQLLEENTEIEDANNEENAPYEKEDASMHLKSSKNEQKKNRKREKAGE